MAMQNYTPMRLPPTIDPLLRNDLLRVDRFLRQLTPWAARVPASPQGTPGLTIDLTKFLYLPGRLPLQRAQGNVTFSMKSANQSLVGTDADVRGFALEGLNDGGTQNFKETIYFSGDYTAGKTITRRWIFPSISGSDTDEFTFASTSGSQTLVGKIITTGQIYVGTAAGRNLFVNAGNQNQQFTISVNTGFPTISTQTPTLRLPPLDVSVPVVDSHTFMFLAAASATPFVSGSIAHGNHAATEMEMLAAGTNESLLQFNVGETVAGCTWTAGGTVITGTFDATKTKIGMRVRGNSGTSIYIERDTKITLVGGSSITVDTPLVGNGSGGVTITTYGPTWTTTIGAGFVDHGTLTGLTDDDHTQYLNLNGRVGGQILSATGGHSHSGLSTDDLAIHGTLVIDPNDQDFAFTQVRCIDSRSKPTGGGILAHQFFYDCAGQATGGTANAVNMQVSGTFAGSTALIARGLNLIGTVGLAAGSTMTEATAGFFSMVPSSSGTGTLTWSRLAGLRVTCGGQDIVSTVAGVPTPITVTNGVCGIEIIVGPKAMQGSLSHICLTELATSTATQAVNYWGIVMATNPGAGTIAARMDMANVADWTFMQIPDAPTNPTGTIRGLKVGNIKSHHVGPFKFGSTGGPTNFVDIAAGTTAIAPLSFTNGTNLTAATAGCVEYDGSFLYMTHGDAVRTKVVTQRGAVDATNQGAAIGATTIYAAPAAGYYVVHYTLETTTADVTAGTIQFQVNYTDDIGATNQTGAALALTVTGRDRGSFEVYCNAAQNIQYQTNSTGIFGTSKYALRVRTVYLG